MISFIIPTLWKSDCIYETIDAIGTSVYGLELIIIDNANSDYVSKYSNVRVIKQETNIFVNPAWNLGVTLARCEYVCLLNDDIKLNTELLASSFHQQVINSNIKETLGVIAYQSGKPLDTEINEPTDTLTLKHLHTRGNGFGQMMILHKDLYHPIPEDLKIYFGDDMIHFIAHNLLKRDVYYFEGLKTVGEFSKTSKPYEENIQKELPYWEQFVTELYNNYKIN